MWRLSIMVLLALLGATPAAQAAPAPDPCSQAGIGAPTAQISDLDDNADSWGVFCEPSPSTGWASWAKQNVAVPSLDGRALECGLTGGAPYANIHCYRNLAPAPSATIITFTLAFQFLPGPTCADTGTACVQALEFSASKWQAQQRYEWAVQWQNVGGPCPRWRYWDPSYPEGWLPLAPPLPQTLRAGQWYHLALVGAIEAGRARYVWFELHEHGAPPQLYAFEQLSAPSHPAADFPDLLAAAVQLDGNSQQKPYRLVIDQVALQRADAAGFAGGPNQLYLPIAGARPAAPAC